MLVYEVLRVVRCCHAAGILHGDIKVRAPRPVPNVHPGRPCGVIAASVALERLLSFMAFCYVTQWPGCGGMYRHV